MRIDVVWLLPVMICVVLWLAVLRYQLRGMLAELKFAHSERRRYAELYRDERDGRASAEHETAILRAKVFRLNRRLSRLMYTAAGPQEVGDGE